MRKFNITGMSCAACSARVEKAVSAIEGVESCSVNLLTDSMTVEGDVTDSEIIEAVTYAGYGASSAEGEVKNERAVTKKEDESAPILARLVFSLVFLAFLMYLSMGHMVGLPQMKYFHGNPLASGLTQMLLSLAVMVINQKFFINGIKGLLHKAPNMDTLVALGSGAAFMYSTAMVFDMTDKYLSGDLAGALHHLHGLYFESAAMILTLITVGKLLESKAKGRTTDALNSLICLSPKTARVIRDGIEKEIPVSELRVGDVFILRPGESVPADGTVIDGHSSVNESALTGESIPVDKESGSAVSAGTVNLSGSLRCEAKKVGSDTILEQIIKTVSDASASKAPIARIADRVSGIFVPTVILISLITVIIWLLADHSIGFAIARGISVLVISCPCALGLATPVAIMVGSGIGARNGVLFKTAEALEKTGKTEIVILDKTGTLTKGKPAVCDIIPAEGITEGELISVAASLESLSEHPISHAVISCAREKDIKYSAAEAFEALPGRGLKGIVKGCYCYGGKPDFIKDHAEINEKTSAVLEGLSDEGKTPTLFCRDGKMLGIIAVSDELKEDSIEAVSILNSMNIRTVMLTGDNEKTARAIAKRVGISQVISGVLPTEKAEAVRELSKFGKTVMVGDGINDAPALTESDIGIAIGGGSDIALDSSDVVLMNGSLNGVCSAIRLSKNTLRNIKENLFWAFFYNVLGIPLAAGAFINLTGWEMNPMIGAAAMSLSSFFVVSNALRLNLIPINKKQRTKKEKNMEKIFKVEGMMCRHCEAHVKKALEAIDGIEEATPSHTEGTVKVKFGKAVPDEVIVKAITDEGYEVK